MDLITVHEDHFCLCSTSPKKSCEDIWSNATADKLVRHYPEVFVKDLGTLPGIVHLRVDENAEPSVTPFTTDPDCPERKVQSSTRPLRESRRTNKSQWAYSMGEHCCYCYKKVRRPKNMHRSTTFEPSLKKRHTSAANPRRLNTRAGSSEELFNHWSYRRVLALCAWRQVQSLDYLCNPLQKIPVEKTPVWSISIMQDLPEMGESSPRRTGRNT